jgi:hypothetical protein
MIAVIGWSMIFSENRYPLFGTCSNGDRAEIVYTADRTV